MIFLTSWDLKNVVLLSFIFFHSSDQTETYRDFTMSFWGLFQTEGDNFLHYIVITYEEISVQRYIIKLKYRVKEKERDIISKSKNSSFFQQSHQICFLGLTGYFVYRFPSRMSYRKCFLLFSVFEQETCLLAKETWFF